MKLKELLSNLGIISKAERSGRRYFIPEDSIDLESEVIQYIRSYPAGSQRVDMYLAKPGTISPDEIYDGNGNTFSLIK